MKSFLMKMVFFMIFKAFRSGSNSLFSRNPAINFTVKYFNTKKSNDFHKIHIHRLKSTKNALENNFNLLNSAFEDILLDEVSLSTELSEYYKYIQDELETNKNNLNQTNIDFFKNKPDFEEILDIIFNSVHENQREIIEIYINGHKERKKFLQSLIENFCDELNRTLLFATYNDFYKMLDSLHEIIFIIQMFMVDHSEGF
ncbi:hypothetical protein EDEG_03792 [Edhazardia aedis USNM 41457]|uniref:Uncharacterized protein n=1 Tax=Edhazardia aedis (strain USNM 41457) TaxID=1003232 RepID=J9DGD7_EDHAE|nr:hypothetical protein EDEG_03792 [Edhazardia aedis USNM 41457]|eukprot:EJW01660.1 hypothetical protein EDEG_03792 [Edhazardia aedis USNM 41457]